MLPYVVRGSIGVVHRGPDEVDGGAPPLGEYGVGDVVSISTTSVKFQSKLLRKWSIYLCWGLVTCSRWTKGC